MNEKNTEDFMKELLALEKELTTDGEKQNQISEQNKQFQNLLNGFPSLLNIKKEIEGTLWAYKFDSDMEDANLAGVYEEKKKELDKTIQKFVNEIDELIENNKHFISQLEEMKSALKK